MKTIFIINPAAGHSKNISLIKEDIVKAKEECGEKVDFYITTCVGDATRYVSEYCRSYGTARFIACGGDGTFSEVLCGMIETPGAEIGVMPVGTGNDFCRNFGQVKSFMSARNQIYGKTVKCDSIKYTSLEKTGYCANMFNIGFDCQVVDNTTEVKKRTFLSGPAAYMMAIFITLMRKKGADLKIAVDYARTYEGKLLLTSIANGSFCGGGIKSNPGACICDGKIDLNIIYNISRLNFLTKLPFYIKGTHIKLKGIENIIYNTKCSCVTVTPVCGKMRVSIDGEVFTMGRTHFEVLPGAFNFVMPEGANL